METQRIADPVVPLYLRLLAGVPPSIGALLIGVPLVIACRQTQQWGPWLMHPVTASAMGGFVLGGAILATWILISDSWLHLRTYLVLAGTFDVVALIAILLSRDQLAPPGSGPYARFVGIAVIPLLLVSLGSAGATVLLQRRRIAALGPGERTVRGWPAYRPLVLLLSLSVVLGVALGLVLLLAPGVVMAVWPWPMTAIESRVLAATALTLTAAAVLLILGLDRRQDVTIAGALASTATWGIVSIFRFPADASDLRTAALLWLLAVIATSSMSVLSLSVMSLRARVRGRRVRPASLFDA